MRCPGWELNPHAPGGAGGGFKSRPERPARRSASLQPSKTAGICPASDPVSIQCSSVSASLVHLLCTSHSRSVAPEAAEPPSRRHWAAGARSELVPLLESDHRVNDEALAIDQDDGLTFDASSTTREPIGNDEPYPSVAPRSAEHLPPQGSDSTSTSTRPTSCGV